MLTQEQQAFARDGAVVLRGVFKDWVETLRAGVAYNESHPGTYFRDYTPEASKGRFWADYCNWPNNASFRDFIENGPAAGIARDLMQSQRSRIFHEHVLVKNAGSGKITPWHHDGPYYPVAAKQTVSLWIPLDPVSRDSTIEFVAGSHRWGKQFQAQSFTGDYYEHTESKEEPLPDIDANRDQYTILGWAVEPGDVVAFDYHTIHGAPGNHATDHARRVVSMRWLGDDAVYVNRGGVTSPPYPHLAATLKTGDPLPEDEFPFVA
ncbi:phytanoyl-CoA dioxygenase family protein [Snodgrassella sp. CFCC 13594]|uniref:phytanoyl-CoA dioxygenase family protein n=1 Tax=Snodgrassella sp. CFCC 13594 TaxID=1775559 RepID=UPI00083760BD|nr:phytanoyl-CoA dioxygenase family protein [Snodgrassella sp. CFCC 13594]